MFRRILFFFLILSLESFLRRGRLRRHSSSLRCYFFLFSLIYFNRHREFWQKRGQHLRILPTNERQHIFIYQSFLYEKRISPRLSEENSTKSDIKFVVLFIANKNNWIHDGMFCMVENGDDDENSSGIKRMAPKKELISSLGICALDLFVLTCSINKGNINEYFEENKNKQFSVVIKEQNYIGWRFPTKLQIKPSQPDQKPRQLVLCISRVFAFERWQLLITALEAYRLFKVDLVVSHVQSALSSVFKLMEAYEREGLLSIRPGIRFPHTKDMQWDPNAETEFNGQILLAHECFYEFRESANFIGLIDWDDLLLPSRHFLTLPIAFAAASKAYTNVAYFLVNKLEANFVERTKSPRKFNLRDLIEEGIKAAPMYNDEKLVILPRRLRGFWMHHSRFLEPKFRPVQLLTNYSIMLHLANEERVEPGEFQMKFLKRFNITEMDRHSRVILAQLERQNMLSHLPRTQIYFDAIAECHGLIFAYYKSITRPTSSRCLSYSLCQLPQVDKPCVVVRSQFHSALTRSGRHAVHIRRASEFVKSQKGCADKFGGI